MEVGFGRVFVRGKGEVVAAARRLSFVDRAQLKTHQSNRLASSTWRSFAECVLRGEGARVRGIRHRPRKQRQSELPRGLRLSIEHVRGR